MLQTYDKIQLKSIINYNDNKLKIAVNNSFTAI